MILIALFLLLLALLLEGTVLALPLVFIIVIIMHIIFRKTWVFIAAFLAGMLLDAMLFRSLGQTTIYFLVFLLLLALYEKKFETRTYPFVFFVSLIGGIAYLGFFGIVNFFVQMLLVVMLALFFFTVLKPAIVSR